MLSGGWDGAYPINNEAFTSSMNEKVASVSHNRKSFIGLNWCDYS